MDIINIEELIKKEDKKEDQQKEDKKEDKKEDNAYESERQMRGFSLHPDFIKAYGDKK